LKKKAKKKFLREKSIINNNNAFVILFSPKKLNSKKLKSMIELEVVFSKIDEKRGIIAAILKNSSGIIIKEIKEILIAFLFKLESRLFKISNIFIFILLEIH
tara:strand:- start:122 stop:427 length:306 start_codon:yes stop_codon:yes gene_type:complete